MATEVKTVVNSAFTQAVKEMHKADIQAIEKTLQPMNVAEVSSRIGSIGGRFFSVDFARKNDKKVNGVVVERAGDIRHMVCRRGVAKYCDNVLPAGHRKAEDERNAVLTVWDVQAFKAEYDEAKDNHDEAGRAAYRRINLAEVKAISIQPIIQV